MKAALHVDCGQVSDLLTKALSNLKNIVIFPAVFNYL